LAGYWKKLTCGVIRSFNCFCFAGCSCSVVVVVVVLVV
jgi:hypothetical protein